MVTVYVAGVLPALDCGGVSGFEWRRTPGEAESAYEQFLRDIETEDRHHAVVLLPLEIPVPEDATPEHITLVLEDEFDGLFSLPEDAYTRWFFGEEWS